MNQGVKYKKTINGCELFLWTAMDRSWIIKQDGSQFSQDEINSIEAYYGEPYKQHTDQYCEHPNSLEYIYGFIDYKLYARNMSEQLEEAN
tara:strand:+ start:219 stop:488 length:270 start_codon:yes stop_codon:yes gene_type:complete